MDDYPELPAPESGGEDLLALLLDLPEKFKTSIYLYYYEGYAVGEIARAMGQSEGTVKSWLHRGRKLLKRLLEEER